jgi:zinc transport system substrate-binding protein
MLDKKYAAVLLGLLFFFVSGCFSQDNAATNPIAADSPSKIRIAVSIVPQASFVQAIGKDRVEVVMMIPPGASPENYAPSPKNMEELSQAQLYFSIGVPAETDGIMPRLKQTHPKMRVIDLAAKVDEVYPAREIAPGEADPHRWLSPKRVEVMVNVIAEELAELDPENAQIYRENAAAYQSQLKQLDNYIKESLAEFNGRSFIVYHPAMGYFADDYGLNMIALEEEGKPASAVSLQSVIDRARKENIKVVFYQAEMDSKQAETLAHELGGEAEMIVPLAADYIDNMKKTADTFARVLQK